MGPHLAEHANELAPVLGTTAKDLEKGATMTDDEIVPRLRARLQHVLAGRQEERARRAEEQVNVAIGRLAGSVRWEDGRAILDERVLFSRDLWATRPKHAVLIADTFEVAVRRDHLTLTRLAVSGFLDTVAWVDSAGLHLRWRGGRGNLKLYPQKLKAHERAAALVIALPAPYRALPPASVRPARQPALLHDVLAELGFP